jgi:hypothetical protein
MLLAPYAVPGSSEARTSARSATAAFPTDAARALGEGPQAAARSSTLGWLISRASPARRPRPSGCATRGLLEPGLRADIKVMTSIALKLHSPELSLTSPAEARDPATRPTGTATRSSPESRRTRTVSDWELPGRLVRGAQSCARPRRHERRTSGLPEPGDRRTDHLRRLAHHRAAEHYTDYIDPAFRDRAPKGSTREARRVFVVEGCRDHCRCRPRRGRSGRGDQVVGRTSTSSTAAGGTRRRMADQLRDGSPPR